MEDSGRSDGVVAGEIKKNFFRKRFHFKVSNFTIFSGRFVCGAETSGFEVKMYIDESEIILQQCDKCKELFEMDTGIYFHIVDIKKRSTSKSFVLCRSCYDKIQDEFLKMMGVKNENQI